MNEAVLQRLLTDPAFRATYLAAGGSPLEALAGRESRSSLAGVALGVAVEGVALFGLAEHAEAAVPSLLENRNLSFDADGVADLRAGRIDPRIVALLEQLSREHRITISSMRSDHSTLTAGGSVSNHSVGRAVDIAAIDGQPVGPGHAGARKLAEALAELDPSIRPTEIGSPWVLAGAAYFTDADHQDHLHVGYDDPPEEGLKLPVDDGGEASGEEVDDGEEGEGTREGGDDEGDAAGDSGGDTEAEADDEDESAEEDGGDEEDGDTREDGGSGDTEAEADDEDEGDDEDDEDEEDGDTREDGGSGDTEAEADDEDEGDEDDDEEDDEEDEDGDEDDEDEDEPDEDDEGDGDAGDGASRAADAAAAYPGSSARKEDVAGWMAARARARGLPSELPIMAALVESGLSNLGYGDADSVGFFQMRTSIWNSGPYAGYPERPEMQLDWFLDHAEEVMKQRVARGLPIDDPRHYGEWIADVERPAEQYRGRYQLRLAEARDLLERVATSVQKLRVITPEQAARARSE